MIFPLFFCKQTIKSKIIIANKREVFNRHTSLITNTINKDRVALPEDSMLLYHCHTGFETKGVTMSVSHGAGEQRIMGCNARRKKKRSFTIAHDIPPSSQEK